MRSSSLGNESLDLATVDPSKLASKLIHAFENTADAGAEAEIRELLPWNWVKQYKPSQVSAG